MNSLERVSLILQHKEADRVPVYPLINSISRKYTGISYAQWARDAEKCAESIIKATDDIDVDCICSLVDLSVEAADFGQEIEYPEDAAARPSHSNWLIKTAEEYSKIEPVNPRKTPRMSGHIKLCDILVKARGKEKPVVAFVFGPLGVLSMMRGQQDLFMDLYDEPDRVKSALEAVNETLLEYVRALIETGVHAVMFDTLFASQSIMSKSMWDEFEGIYVEELAQYVHGQGRMVMIHNCGTGIYFDAQIKRMKPEAISFLHIPDDCSSFAEAKEKYGNVTTLIGHIPPEWLITATKEEIEEECRKEIEMHKKGGGFILATGCEFPSVLGPEKAKYIVEACRKYGKY